MTIRWAWEADPAPAHLDADVLHRLRDRIDAVIGREQGRYVELMRDLLRMPTVSGADDPEEDIRYRIAIARCLARVQAEARSLGMEWRTHGGIAAVAEWSGSGGTESIGVATHLDVVPAGDDWDHPPFSGDLVDGFVWGRGAQDDKGPAAMALAAVHVLRELGVTPEKDIRLLYGTYEETDDWPDLDLLLMKETPPDLVLVPDGAFPIIVGEKGLMTLEWRVKHDPPPIVDNVRFMSFEGGERANVVPGAAELLVACEGDLEGTCRRFEAMEEVAEVEHLEKPPPSAEGSPCLRVRFVGRSCHAAFPEDGENAALKGLRVLQRVMPRTDVGHFAGLLVEHCTDLHGNGFGLHRSHDYMGDSTVNLGVVQLAPTGGHAEINVRFPLGITVDEVQQAFIDAAQQAPEPLQVKTAVPGRPQDPIYISPEDHPRLIHTLQAAYQVGTGREPKLAAIPGTTYAKAFPLALSFGPQDPSADEPVLAHQRNERVHVDRYLENVRVYALALALLACDEGELARAVSEE